MDDFDVHEMVEDTNKTVRCISCVHYDKGSSELVTYANCRKTGERSRFDGYCGNWSTVDWESLINKEKPLKEERPWKSTEENPIDAKLMAEKLICIYDKYQEPFKMTTNKFKKISGRKKLEDAYLDHVDSFLRGNGYVLLNLRKEKKMVGVIKMSTILESWKPTGLLLDSYMTRS
jgi:hypothetical protein